MSANAAVFLAEPILILAPTAADAALSRGFLTEAGFASEVCFGLQEIESALPNAGALLLTEDVLGSAAFEGLVRMLQTQPAWSDIPVLLLSATGADSTLVGRAMEAMSNVTVLERPVRVSTLISGLRTALRSRRRQYEMRDQLAMQDRQTRRLRLLWEAASVLLEGKDPQRMMGSLFERIAPHFGLDVYFNFLVTEEGDALRLNSCAGIPAEEQARIERLEFGEAVCGNVALRRSPIVATDIQHSNDPKVQLVKGYGICAYACNPLIADGKLLGTLSFASRSRDRFEPDEIEFLETICHYVTVAYERVRLIGELRETDRRKDEFLATLAHELRNPLAPIRNALQILKAGGHDGKTAQLAHGVMERQLQQMVRLIDDLLDVSRITQGKLELRKEQVLLAEIIKSAVETTRPLIERCRHELLLDMPSQPVLLMADPVRLAQVFSNLLNNAAKYMEPGGRIWLTAVCGPGHVRVSVRDAGMGIPTAQLDLVFDMFAQVDHSLERSQGGLGIGLTLVRQLAGMHGGQVTAFSEGEGRGSEFRVILPVLEKCEVTGHRSEAARQEGKAQPSRILVADDNVDSADSMSMMLGLMGHEVRTVHDGEAALREAEAFRPRLALLDIGMPRLNGHDVARAIRAADWGGDMVLVALTGWGQEEDKRRAMRAGFDRHFTKPVNLEELQEFMAERVPHFPTAPGASAARASAASL